MPKHKVVSQDEWIKQRKAFLVKEKEFTRARDRLTRERQELPWTEVTKEYKFEGPNGTETLSDLFAGKSQLIVYHFMFHPEWTEGCKGCSYLADNYDGALVHLEQRDTTFVTISHAAYNKLESFRKRMGWKFKWLSAHSSDFNYDFNVSFEPNDKNEVYYNYSMQTFPVNEGPGLSVFYKDEDGKIFHTYSMYGRGLEDFLLTYRFLDVVPKGRDESKLPMPMAWVRHHDKYGDPTHKDMYLELAKK